MLPSSEWLAYWLVTGQTVIRSGNFSFERRPSSDRLVVANVAVRVIGHFIGEFCGRRLVWIYHGR
jgi:hypothetical protein